MAAMPVTTLLAACYSAACAPPSAGGSGGSLPGGPRGSGGASISSAPKPSEMSAKAFRNGLLRDGFDVAAVRKLTSRSWEVTTSDGKKVRISGGGSLDKIPRDDAKATMRRATDEDVARLKIPKTWRREDIMVSKDPDGDDGCLARGFDAKTGAPRSLYSAAKTAHQSAEKYERVKRIAQHLDKLDEALSASAATDDTAAALMVIRRTGQRPGSKADAAARPATYGITSLQARHVQVLPNGNVRLVFNGKDSVRQSHLIKDPELVAVIKSRLNGKNPTDKLFATDEKQVNSRLDEIIGEPGFNVKDLRTVKANVTALQVIAKMPVPKSKRELTKARTEVGRAVAKVLGNDGPTALKSYINPTVFDEWSRNVQP